MSKPFERVLLGVFYSSMLLNPNLTLEYLKTSGFQHQFFSLALSSWRSLRLSYERKLCSLALTNLLFNSQLSQELPPGDILRELVSLLVRQQRVEQFKNQLAGKRKPGQTNPIIDDILQEEEFKGDSEEEE
jgi:hypothetical protein